MSISMSCFCLKKARPKTKQKLSTILASEASCKQRKQHSPNLLFWALIKSYLLEFSWNAPWLCYHYQSGHGLYVVVYAFMACHLSLDLTSTSCCKHRTTWEVLVLLVFASCHVNMSQHASMISLQTARWQTKILAAYVVHSWVT